MKTITDKQRLNWLAKHGTKIEYTSKDNGGIMTPVTIRKWIDEEMRICAMTERTWGERI